MIEACFRPVRSNSLFRTGNDFKGAFPNANDLSASGHSCGRLPQLHPLV